MRGAVVYLTPNPSPPCGEGSLDGSVPPLRCAERGSGGEVYLLNLKVLRLSRYVVYRLCARYHLHLTDDGVLCAIHGQRFTIPVPINLDANSIRIGWQVARHSQCMAVKDQRVGRP